MDVRKQPWGRGRPRLCTQHSTFICSLLKLATARGLHGLSLSLSLSPCAFAPFQDASLGLRSDALLKEALSKPRPRAEAILKFKPCPSTKDNRRSRSFGVGKTWTGPELGAADPRSVLTFSRVRHAMLRGNQIHSVNVWTLGIPKMYMGTLGY